MNTVISVENVSKFYALGVISHRTFSSDAARFWASMRNQPDPLVAKSEKDPASMQGQFIWALRDVSFDVQQGEVVGIIGRNGAGKSTILKILSRVTAPTYGQVKVKGRIASLLEVGTGFHPELTGRENIFLNSAILGMSRAETRRKFDEILDFAEVEEFIDTPVKRYSSGMYVRLAFAVAAHLDPEILIVDEVLAVGDAAFQKKCLGKINNVATEGRTVLLVSHNMVAVGEFCQRCILLEHGRIAQNGPTQKVLEMYAHPLRESSAGSFDGLPIKGDGQIELLSYSVTNQSGEENILPLTNEDVTIHVRMRVNEEIHHPAVGIGIHTEQGVLLTSVSSVEQGILLDPFHQGEMVFDVKLCKIPYIAGFYRMDLWFTNPQGHYYARADDTIRFEVGQSAIYGVSQVDARWGSVYAKIQFGAAPDLSAEVK